MIAATGLAIDARAAGELGHFRGFDPIATAAAMQAQAVATLITDPRREDNPIVFVNEAAAALTGYGAEEMLGRNCRLLIGAETDPAALAKIRAAMAAEASLEIEIRLHRKDGAGCWNRVILAPLRVEAGVVAYFILNIIDIAVERDCVDALEEHNRVLTMMGEALARQNRELARTCAALKHQIEGTHAVASTPRSTH